MNNSQHKETVSALKHRIAEDPENRNLHKFALRRERLWARVARIDELLARTPKDSPRTAALTKERKRRQTELAYVQDRYDALLEDIPSGGEVEVSA